MDIKKKVDNLIKKYETSNPFLLCKYLKITILFLELGKTKGYFKKTLRKKFIIINSELSEFERKIVCAHELAHAILHSSNDMKFMLDNDVICKRNVLEVQANEFVKFLLIKDMEFEDRIELKHIRNELLSEIFE
ncbi:MULTISPECIES: ImmA/IrrE family metallo-endopeptidase [Fusobacterium]|uniref:ImmA/IrrE family metallo-endopeptidase n=1 Tax=Fusobacterium TaxID=848 RepID=UPI0008A2B61C|nr:MULTISPECIES: ImmA/IrrE family metallo-endopeptidase [Fusobacterium]MCF0171653.1 ImmA/IrrE family metallo-endopeptidase [Fusobacterium varium]MCF0188834.1 ImmA/IrrE family metallo-endopeptidase [Bacteroidaceae bacterium]OFL92944.1 hypothetical protein HMPREF2747_06615 [Fusobacterium sp. HMSC073F01]HBJ80153.1 ImmA/IrrE family metallo-endopeptidase [Fusobacterium sp.]